ncbi:MAG: NUDIX hydrolase [Candidatus Helarchaeota archaeon]
MPSIRFFSKENVKKSLKNRNKFKIAYPEYRHSAVLLLLFEKDDEPHVILTKRANNLKKHKGEISFPGGKIEEGDESLLDTALRETEEEIHLPREKIEILGELDDMFTLTHYVISPFVGYVQYPFDYSPNKTEVEYIIETPLHVFLNKDTFSEKLFDFHGKKFPVFYYQYDEHTIWGATAYMLNQFVEIVFGFNPSAHPEIKRLNPEEFQ